ncbi:MAG: hypothetical protein ABWY00_10225 [Dongiaceae bacterium]
MTMKAEETKITFPWTNAPIGGWGMAPQIGPDVFETQMKHLQNFAQGLQQAYSETLNKQMEVLNSTGERVAQTMQEMARCQGAGDVLTVETQLATVVLDSASQRTQAWFELGRKLQDCFAGFALASFEELRKQGEEAAEAAESAAHETGKSIKAVKNATKQAA